jgi:hypothetical protein
VDDGPDPGPAPVHRVDVTSSSGVLVGDGNVQHNTFNFLFGGRQPDGPVVAGKVPQAPPAFQPREDLMARLRAAGSGVSVVRALTGMRGVGKTQLAAAYARECGAAGWRLVAWVDAEDMSVMLSGLAVVADRLGIDRADKPLEAIGLEVRNRLEADGERCLIVFDNVVDFSAVRPYLPSLGAPQVVMTTTEASVGTAREPLTVGVFRDEEAQAFLAERTGRDGSADARHVAVELGHLPLALAQAAAVIAAQRLSYQTYLDRLRAYPASKVLPPAKNEPYPRGTAEAILLSLDALGAADPAGLGRTILAVMSLLSPAGISREFLYAGGAAGIWAGDEEAVDEALGRLADMALLNFSDDGSTVSVHRLVMRVIRERRARDGTLAGLGLRCCSLLLSAEEPIGELWRHRAPVRELFQQVQALNDHLASYLETGREELAETLLSLRVRALRHFYDLGDGAAQVIEFGEPLVADCARVLGADHPDTLMARNHLAQAYQAAGRYSEAVAVAGADAGRPGAGARRRSPGHAPVVEQPGARVPGRGGCGGWAGRRDFARLGWRHEQASGSLHRRYWGYLVGLRARGRRRRPRRRTVRA